MYSKTSDTFQHCPDFASFHKSGNHCCSRSTTQVQVQEIVVLEYFLELLLIYCILEENQVLHSCSLVTYLISILHKTFHIYTLENKIHHQSSKDLNISSNFASSNEKLYVPSLSRSKAISSYVGGWSKPWQYGKSKLQMWVTWNC